MSVYIDIFIIFCHLFILTGIQLKCWTEFAVFSCLCNKYPAAVHIPPQTPYLFTIVVMEILWALSSLYRPLVDRTWSQVRKSAKLVCSPGTCISASWARLCHSHLHICVNYVCLSWCRRHTVVTHTCCRDDKTSHTSQRSTLESTLWGQTLDSSSRLHRDL